MKDRDYILKESEMILNYIIDDNEKFNSKKQVYARVYNSIKSSVTCEFGGLNNLDISNEEVKQLIKDVVNQFIDKIYIN